MLAAPAVTWPLGASAQPLATLGAVLCVPGPGSSISLPLELALRAGLDRVAGLTLKLRFVSGGALAARELVTGNADHAVFGLPAAMRANLAEGADLALLAALDDLPLYTLVVRKDLAGAIRRVGDLRGRVLGVHSDSLTGRTTSHLLAELLLRQAGVRLTSVRFVACGQTWESQSAALISRTVDASMCDEPFATRLESAGLAATLYSTGNPADAATTPGAGFLRGALIARRSAVLQSPERSARVVHLLQASLAWMRREGPDAVTDVLGLSGDEREAWLAVARRYPRQYSADGGLSAGQLAETDRFFRSANPDLPGASQFRAADMVIGRWVAQRP